MTFPEDSSRSILISNTSSRNPEPVAPSDSTCRHTHTPPFPEPWFHSLTVSEYLPTPLRSRSPLPKHHPCLSHTPFPSSPQKSHGETEWHLLFLNQLVLPKEPLLLSRVPSLRFCPAVSSLALASPSINLASTVCSTVRRVLPLPNLPARRPLTAGSRTCPQRPSSSPHPCCCPTKRSQKFCQPARIPRLEAAMNPNPLLRPRTARIRHLFSPLPQTLPPLWPPRVPASVPLRGLEALLFNSTVSTPRISSPLGSRTPLTPEGPTRAKDGVGYGDLDRWSRQTYPSRHGDSAEKGGGALGAAAK